MYLASLYHPETQRVISHKVVANMTKKLATSVLEKVNLRAQGIESFHSILKREYVNFQSFQTLDEAIIGIDSYIRWYNNDRIFPVSPLLSRKDY